MNREEQKSLSTVHSEPIKKTIRHNVYWKLILGYLKCGILRLIFLTSKTFVAHVYCETHRLWYSQIPTDIEAPTQWDFTVDWFKRGKENRWGRYQEVVENISEILIDFFVDIEELWDCDGM